MSQTLNAALVGYGFAGKTFHAPFLTSTPGLSLGWVVSRDAAKVQANLPVVGLARWKRCWPTALLIWW